MTKEAQSTPPQEIKPGTIVLFDLDGKTQLGSVVKVGEKKLSILSQRKRNVELPTSRLDALPGSLPSSLASDSSIAEHLLSTLESCSNNSSTIPVSDLWELVSDEPREYTGAELTTMYFGENTLNDHLTLRLALHSDPIYFKRKKYAYLPRTPSTVEELKRAQEAKKKNDALLEKITDECIAGIAATNSSATYEYSDDAKTFLNKISLFAAEGDAKRFNKKEIQLFLEEFEKRSSKTLKGTAEQRAYNFLKLIGYFHQFTNLTLIKLGTPDSFSQEAIQQSAAITNSYHRLEEGREDCRSLEVFTIDERTTKDMDDGLSLEISSDSYRVGIHITDVNSLIPINSALDNEARARGTSAYLPSRTINMLPDEIAQSMGSLVEGEERNALSCFITFSRDREIIDYKICRTLICSQKKLSYTEVDKLLSPPVGDIGTLYEIAMSYASLRLSQGGMKIPKRMAKAVFENKEDYPNTSFHLEDYNETTPARELVSEMAILANECFAGYAAENQIPFYYRAQEAADEEKLASLSSVPPGPAQDYVLRTSLKRSFVEMAPAPHATLGVPQYGQVTSPLRRYADLINQRQIAAHLSSKDLPYNTEQLQHVLAEISEQLEWAKNLTRNTHRTWMLRGLKQIKNEPLMATVIKDDGKRYLVELDKVYIPALLKSSEKLQRGDQVKLEIQNVDPRYDYLKLHFLNKVS